LVGIDGDGSGIQANPIGRQFKDGHRLSIEIDLDGLPGSISERKELIVFMRVRLPAEQRSIQMLDFTHEMSEPRVFS